jgi:hypothetical protein
LEEIVELVCEENGFEHVAAYLGAYDLSRFEWVKEPPPKTKAFWRLVGSGCSPEAAMIEDLLDTLGRPDAATVSQIKEKATGELAIWFLGKPAENRLRHFLEECGYQYFPNPTAKNTYWKINGKRQAVYTRNGLSAAAQLKAVADLKPL